MGKPVTLSVYFMVFFMSICLSNKFAIQCTLNTIDETKTILIIMNANEILIELLFSQWFTNTHL